MTTKAVIMFLMLTMGVCWSAGCDKNSTPVNEPDAPRESARNHIRKAIELENESARFAITKTLQAGVDGTTAPISMSIPESGGTPLGNRSCQVAGLELSVPASWQAVESDHLSAMRAAEFRISPAGDEQRGAEIVFYYFGSGQGGSAEANIQRWIGQVERESGVDPQIAHVPHPDLKITSVYLEGTLKPTMMGPGPKTPLPGSALFGAVIEGGPRGSVFLKATGSQSAISRIRPHLENMLKSTKPIE